MKKKMLTTLCTVALSGALMLSACGTSHTTHVDADNDGKCDECGETMQTTNPHNTHYDLDNDGKCDECGETMQQTAPGDNNTGDDNTGDDNTGVVTPPAHTEHVDADGDGKCDECGETMQQTTPPVEEPFTVSYREGYTPTRFDANVLNEITELGEGVHLVKNTVKRGELTCVVWAIEVDLNKANIVAGTKNNQTTGYDYLRATPYSMAQAWERDNDGHVYASVNADFFNPYVSNEPTINAFVKDGVILHDGHKDNNNYDYKNTDSDVPASAPMLFGINGTKAQIAPIIKVDGDPTEASVKKQLVQAKLSYALIDGDTTYDVRENANAAADYISYRTSGTVNMTRGYAVKLDISGGLTALKVLEVIEITSRTPLTAEDGIGWMLCTSSTNENGAYLASRKAGDVISFSVASPDGTWNGYQTILGCRQALVTNDAVASTVTLENSNGAQSAEVPRTAVGLKDDHTVVVFAVESLHYYGKNVKDSDPHGMNLPQLAEFIYYYGCTEAANFDGGGSTQLVVRGDEEEAGRVLVRSADYGTEGLFDTRIVANALLVTKR